MIHVRVLVGSGLFSASMLLFTAACSSEATSSRDAGPEPTAADAAVDVEAPVAKPDAAAPVDLRNCDLFCAKAAPICPNPNCRSDCEKQLRQTPGSCQAEVVEVVRCSAEEGKVTGCNKDGKANVEGCNAQLFAYLGCLTGGGGKPDAGPQRCAEMTRGAPVCDACLDAKCCAEETACLDSPDCISYRACIARGTDEAQCASDHPRGQGLAASIEACRTSRCAIDCP